GDALAFDPQVRPVQTRGVEGGEAGALQEHRATRNSIPQARRIVSGEQMAEAKGVSAREAREVAEAARESEWRPESFVRDLFDGKLRLDLIHPYPKPDPEDEARARPFLEALERFLRKEVDGDEIDRTGKVPPHVVDGLRR